MTALDRDAATATRVVAEARAEIDALARHADAGRRSLQQAAVDLWPRPTGGPAPVGRLLAMWSLGCVAPHWAALRDRLEHDEPFTREIAEMELLGAVAAGPWTEQSIRVDGVALSRMLLRARPPHGAVRAAARVAAGAIARIDGGVSLVAHAESEGK